VRTALALIRHVMLASRGSDSHVDMADTLARDGAARSPHVVAAFRAVDRAQFLPADARADAYIDSPARSGVFHQSSPSIYAAALEALDLGGARRRSFLNIGSGTGYFSALCAAAAAAAGGELSPHVGVERHAELVDWARTRTTTDPAARIRAELAAFSSSSLADHLADIAPYAAARGASSLAELAALPADTLDDMIASAGWSILKAATFRRHLARYHDEHAGRTWLPPRAPDVFYDVGDVFDVVEALRDAHSPLRGRFDRVYVGAGVDRSSCRVLLRLLAPDGLLVAPRDDRHGEAQRLVTARFPRHKTSICVRALRSSRTALNDDVRTGGPARRRRRVRSNCWRARGLCIARASERWRDCGVRASSCWARLERGGINV
jgi:protein-L-isoaspartate O-methyltransferase